MYCDVLSDQMIFFIGNPIDPTVFRNSGSLRVTECAEWTVGNCFVIVYVLGHDATLTVYYLMMKLKDSIHTTEGRKKCNKEKYYFYFT